MVKRKKHAGSRSTFDNPLAAARKGKTTTPTPAGKKEAPESRPSSENPAVDWIEFGNSKKLSYSKHKNSSKMSKKAEQIWHKRSGAGFHLFVEYYLGQPHGVVANETIETKKDASSQQQQQQFAHPPPAGGAGQSRAALRRKKKKRRKTTTANGDCEGPSQNEGATNEVTKKTDASSLSPINIIHSQWQDQLRYNGRLLDILSSKTNNTNTYSDFRSFLVALSKPLPLTFRFRRHEGFSTNDNDGCNTILSAQQRKRKIQKIAGLRRILESKTLARANVRPVPFDPDYIYQAMAPPVSWGAMGHKHPFPIDKASLKKLCPELKEFLNEHTLDGTIARQELGSILPVWLLDKVGAFSRCGTQGDEHRLLRVLDTCASPGSKTLQAAELVSTKKGGRIRANDVNANRLESLKEAIERSGFFGRNDSDSDASGGGGSMESMIRFSDVDASKYPIPKSEAKKYPVILCDVPCSGDGTSRKDIHIIPNWTPSISNSLHSLQVDILARALKCTSMGGIVSYSTCSLNPIEDEAVVGAVLEKERKEGKFGFELIQVSESLLNGLILRPGLGSWRVADFDPLNAIGNSNNATERDDGDSSGVDDSDEQPAKLTWHDSYSSALDSGMEGALESMWPQASSEKDKPSLLPLDRCLRLFPQDQDTGGFFVALIKRTK